LSFFKSLIVVLSICIITVGISWFSVFYLLGIFIDKAPYTVGNVFYLSEIVLTFLLYASGSYLAIKYTKCYPLIAAIPVGLTGLIFYYIELGGLDCVGTCGMPFWYDLTSFFKHIIASVLVSLLYIAKNKLKIASAITPTYTETSSGFSKLFNIKSMIIVCFLLTVGLLITAKVFFTDIAKNTKTVSIYSSILKEQRNVTVFIPSGYTSNDESYDVLYTLDGENLQHNFLAAATAKILASLGIIPEIIIVAIDGQGMRQRDFRLKGAVAVDGRKTSGEARQFQQFLENELIPKIAKAFRTSNRKLLAGHSYGALFTAYSFAEHGGSFDGYFCFSPSFQDSNTSVMSFKKGLINNSHENKFIYLNLGLEGGAMRALFKQVETAIDSNDKETLPAKVSYYSLPHALIMVPGYFEALVEFYKKQDK